MPTIPPFVRLDGRATTLLLDLRGEQPAVLHWRAALPPDVDPATLALLAARDTPPSSPDPPPPLTLTPLLGAGFPGRPGLLAHRGGRDWASWLVIAQVTVAAGSVEIVSHGGEQGLRLTHRLRLDPAGDVLIGSAELANTGATPLEVEACAAPVLPIPSPFTHLTLFEGRWAGEFRTRRVERGQGAVVRENRRGRTSHDAFPLVFAETADATEAQGEAYGVHLAWSGNHRLWVETLPDGRAFVQMGELLLPGELRLVPGETYRSPEILCAYSGEGRSGASRAFHAHVRARPEHMRVRAEPRLVHCNTWEAIYFDHDPARLARLVDAAAELGVERFVLDDGWFKARRDDTVALGDWTPDSARYPEGLGPLIAQVNAHGMAFGLWVEPEGVNADSDLYRAHPDWVLAAPPAPQLAMRNQLTLDFGRVEVREHVWRALDALLSAHPIAYLKWDMNRDLSHPGGADECAAAGAHVRGLYAVLARLRAEHPQVEVESCASGGARADLGVLAFTDRVWASDSNDALDRLAIQAGLSHLLPLELIGAHVGPAECHITGRRLCMATRVATALFGHFGVEADLLELSLAEHDELAAGIALYKAHRDLLHTGRLHRLDRPPGEAAQGVVAQDGSAALFAFTLLEEPRGSATERLRLAGLDPSAVYRVAAVWPRDTSALGPALRSGFKAPGAVLMRVGLEVPRLRPGHGFVLRLERAE